MPSVVLTANLVASPAPVVERQADRPDNAECHNIVDLLRGEAIHPGPHSIVDVVHGREERPDAIDLAPVPVDLRENQEDREQREREREARNDRVGRGVHIFQAFEISNVRENLLGKGVELRDIRFDGLAVGCTIGQCFDDGH